jgi:cell division protein FtsQ
LKRTDALPVRTIAVRGVSDARAAEVTSYAGVEPGASLFSLDLAAVAARVSEHPWVKDAAVRVVPPDGLEIVVAERAPKALLAVGDLYLVDEEGAPFKAARPGDGLDLPVVTGLDAERVAAADGKGTDDVRAALALLAEHERQGVPGGTVSEVVVVQGVGLDVVFTSGLRVRMGRGDFPGKLLRLASVLKKLETEKLQASFVYLDDARRPERVAVRLRGGAERLPSSGT